MRTMLYAVILAILSSITSTAWGQADKPATRPVAVFDLSGPWQGVFAIDLSTTYLADVDLKPTDNHGGLSGEIHFVPDVPPALAKSAASMEGSWRVSATVDPATRTITLATKGWVKQAPMQQFTPLDMSAVYSSERDELAGQFVRQPTVPGVVQGPSDLPYFVFVRAGPDHAEAVANLKKLADHTLRPPPVRRARNQPAGASPTPPTEAALTEWSARYGREYPGSVEKDRTDKIAAQSMPLLNDATFKPVFGETYDAVGWDMIDAAIERLHGRDPDGAQHRVDPEFFRQTAYLEYVLHPNGQRIISVAAMRTIDAWQAESLARFRTEPVTASTLDDIAATQKAIALRMPYAWPSDRKLTQVAFDQLRDQVAGTGVIAMADRAVAGASGMQGLKMLAGWAQANASALDHADTATRAAAKGRIDAQLDKLLIQLLEPYEARLGKLGSGVDAVSAGASWHREMVEQFTFVAPRPPCQDIMNRFAARRTKDLTDGQAMLLTRIEKSASPEDVDRVFADLTFPTDAQSPGYPMLIAAKEKRLKAIEVERLMATFSKDEQDMMDRPGHIDLTKYKQTPPSAEECRLALLRMYSVSSNGRMIDAHNARYSGHFGALEILPLIITATEEKLAAFHPSEDPKGYWDVDLHIMLQGKIPEDNILASTDPHMRQGAQAGADMVNAVNRALGPQSMIITLRLEEDGWQVLGAHEAGAVEAAMNKLIKLK